MSARERLRRWALPTPINPSRVHLERWLQNAAASLTTGRVLDAGAGSAPYRRLFDHLDYEAADHHDGESITHVCDLASIPVEDERFDLVIATQVLEHIPDPVAVLTELRRVTRAGGSIWMSAPLFFEEHEKPYDFYRYTEHAWRHLAEAAELSVENIQWLEGYYGTLSYQLGMASRTVRSLPLRLVLAWSATFLARRDLNTKITDRGMPKNYTVVLRR